MTIVGIDFSLNSPSVCVSDGSFIDFISLFNTEGCEWKREKPLKKFQHHNALDGVVRLVPYQRGKAEAKAKGSGYSEEQVVKTRDADMLAALIVEEILRYMSGDSVVALEGFAYASKGASFIDLIMFNSFLRKSVADAFGPERLLVIAPTEAKKHAGKGNADKEYMIGAFVANRDSDPILPTTPLYSYIANISPDWKNIKPLDDLVDAYWIMRTAAARYSK